MTLPLGGGHFRKPTRQRSKSDTYMTSPLSFSPPEGFSFRVDQPGDPSELKTEDASVDPRRLDVQSPMPDLPSPAPLGLATANQQQNTGIDALPAGRDSQAGPSARRKSAVGPSTPYDPAFSASNISPGNQISPTGQVFLVPPTSAARRSRSPGHHSGHRAVRSEDFSSFTPRTAQFLLETPTSIQVPRLPDMPASTADGSHQQGFQPMSDFFQGQSAFFDNFQNVPQMPTNGGGFQQDMPHNGAMGQPSYSAYNIPVDTSGNILPPDSMQMGAGYGYYNAGWPQNPSFGNGSSGGPPGQIQYSALDDDNLSVQLDPRSLAARGRRRSSVRSDTSGYSGISGAGSEGVTLESKTTEATKQAARRRRKDPNNAKFSCDYCGETFTRCVLAVTCL